MPPRNGLEFWSMAKRPGFALSFAPQAIEHLDLIETKYHGFPRRTIKEQLTYTPAEENPGIRKLWNIRFRSRHPGGPSSFPRRGKEPEREKDDYP